MNLNIGKEVAALQRMTVRELRTRYAEVFGEETRAGNKPWLVKRIAWRLQSLAEGDISERARQRVAELANDADVRLSPPKVKPSPLPSTERTKSADFLANAEGAATALDESRREFVELVAVLADHPQGTWTAASWSDSVIGTVCWPPTLVKLRRDRSRRRWGRWVERGRFDV
ncbi:MAG: DUF2924 domain-containing protein [Pirellulales bacterium]